MQERRSKSTRRRTVRALLLAGSAPLLASCTVAVSQLAPDPPDGGTLSLVLEVMAEAAQHAEAADSQRAEQAVRAVTAWRAGGSPEGGGSPE